MGKGDAKSKRGKISKGSYGNSRPKKTQNKATKLAKLNSGKAAAASA